MATVHWRSRRGYIIAAVIAVAVLVAVAAAYVSLYTDLLWYRSVHFSSVFTTLIKVKLFLFFVFGIAMGAVIAANAVIAYRLRPTFPPPTQEQHALERYRTVMTPYAGRIIALLSVIAGILSGVSAAGAWRTWLAWRHGVSFGVKDPQFHRDASYFVFTYPFQRFIVGYAFALVIVGLFAAVITHYLYAGIRLQSPGHRITRAAHAHLSVLFGLLLILKAIAYYLDRYGLVFSARGFVTSGASYTDVHATLPAKTILLAVALICAALFFANVAYRTWLLPTVAVGVMVLSAIVIGGIYPAIVQQFTVRPNEAAKEAPYISRGINATRAAYGLSDVNYVRDYPGVVHGGVARAASDPSLGLTRLLDPNVLNRTFQQLQRIRAFYQFADTLDIDRYNVSGKTDEYVVGVRELDLNGIPSRNWINEHLVYTHGFGFVATPVDSADRDGRPNFAEGGIPPTGPLGAFEPRVYYGEDEPSYSIVGAPANAKPQELDRPSDTGTGQVNTTYTGKGGVKVGSTWRRLLYALKYGEKNLLLSSAINKDSKILYVRDPRARVHKVAPYLQLDGDPYPVVVDGRILWIVDGYTTADGYPYSHRIDLNTVTNDALTRSASVAAQPKRNINYIRNSVKATVDAYDGTVTLYAWDPSDPVLRTWMRVFPGTVKPRSEMPAGVLAHVRYPEDLFKVQRDLLGRYHVDDPRAFYSGQDFWKVPADPTDQSGVDQPPYYIYTTPVSGGAPDFSLTSAMVARNAPNLAALTIVSSDPSRDYGKISVLVLPRETQVNGPGQVQSAMQSTPDVSRDITLFSQHGSEVIFGNLLTLPVSGGLIYIEPLYVQGSSEAYPLLRKVLVSYGNNIGYADTLSSALAQAFGTPPPSSSSGGGTAPPPTTSGQVSAALKQALADAQQAYADAQAALKRGDFAAYGAAQQRLAAALQRAAAAAGK